MLQRKEERLTQIYQEVVNLALRYGEVDWDEKNGGGSLLPNCRCRPNTPSRIPHVCSSSHRSTRRFHRTGLMLIQIWGLRIPMLADRIAPITASPSLGSAPT
jgi:hypothetical protein